MAKELYVGHLPYEATNEDLRRLFSVAGTVTSVHIITDPVSGKSKGCGYVRMSSEEELQEAIDCLDGALVEGLQITVSIARPQKPQAAGGRPGPARRSPAPKAGSPQRRQCRAAQNCVETAKPAQPATTARPATSRAAVRPASANGWTVIAGAPPLHRSVISSRPCPACRRVNRPVHAVRTPIASNAASCLGTQNAPPVCTSRSPAARCAAQQRQRPWPGWPG